MVTMALLLLGTTILRLFVLLLAPPSQGASGSLSFFYTLQQVKQKFKWLAKLQEKIATARIGKSRWMYTFVPDLQRKQSAS